MKHKISQEIHHKVKWTVEEDEGLKRLVQSHGPTKWNKISVNLQALFGFIRNSTQCRDRWLNHVDPELKTGPWTDHEDKLIFYGQALLGNAWVEIAKSFLGRTDHSIKNRWLNHVIPELKTGPWTAEEDKTILNGQALHGNK